MIDEFESLSEKVSITKFCNDKNISKDSFYYFRKKFKKNIRINYKNDIFQEIKINEEATTTNNTTLTTGEVNITIGNINRKFFSKFKEFYRKAKDALLKKLRRGGLKSVDDIFTKGKNVLDNFDIDKAYVKPKHLSTSGGNGAKFLGDSNGSAEAVLHDALKNGKVNSIIDNGLTQQGKQSYRIVIDAGKEIGTKGETLIRIVISEDGGMLSAFPVK